MKNLLVTGGCGFIGSNFIHHLFSGQNFDGRVINVDKLTYAGNIENLAGIEKQFPDRYIFSQTDICDKAALDHLFEIHAIDAVCHFAAESHVDRSIIGPDDFVKTNILGTFNLLEIIRNRKDQVVLFHHVSTDEVYGSLGRTGLFTEKTPYDPSSPYSASKASSDHLVRAYHRTYGIPVTISNCSNNYGPFQFPEKLIPLMVLNARAGKPLPVYGQGVNIRDWLYVNDHCRAVWSIMQQGEKGQTYNIGGRCEMKNIDVVELICDILDDMEPLKEAGSRKNLITFVKDRPGHDLRYAIDYSKLNEALGWDPEETFASGLKKTICWYLDNPEWTRRVQSGEYRKWIDTQYN
ncbi:MAG: dTDP-glucose 4,6-dehydratase [Deltaproteobacteria bacterium]|nr:dTDP-glucose 4,6-dehydratase [Deltaproteobacteria bacterium]